MIQITRYPTAAACDALLQRPSVNYVTIQHSVQTIIDTVKKDKDAALRKYAWQFDKVTVTDIELPKDEWQSIADTVSADLKAAIDVAIKNITAFHALQKETVIKTDTMPGVTCWRRSVAIDRVGLYIPGGTAVLFSTLLMLAIPASIAGCREIVVCTPPSEDGSVHNALVYAALQTGVHKIYRTGGAQAIAAMAYGTETISPVYKIVGPGNMYVTLAKMLVNSTGMAIDMPAGPSELAVLADSTCVPAYVAADLLSQAEHDVHAQVVLVSDSETVLTEVNKQLAIQLNTLPRKDIAIQALQNSKAILVRSIADGITLLNNYAPEHLIIACADDEAIAAQVTNAGSVFLGNYAPESAGDYASGTNHTLPTGGYARSYSGVSVDSFIKKITFQKLTRQGLYTIANAVETMANAEGLVAHANAVKIRTHETI